MVNAPDQTFNFFLYVSLPSPSLPPKALQVISCAKKNDIQYIFGKLLTFSP